jgi:hypothetical protein
MSRRLAATTYLKRIINPHFALDLREEVLYTAQDRISWRNIFNVLLFKSQLQVVLMKTNDEVAIVTGA